MLIEVPDLDVVAGWMFAFVIGLLSLFVFYSIRARVDSKGAAGRLRYYEQQLVDMRVRMDVLEDELAQQDAAGRQEAGNVMQGEAPEPAPQPERRIFAGTAKEDVVSRVLHLITENTMTSRDIQGVIGKTREHTSRLMKKLADEGYVIRNRDAKPYTYHITGEGRQRIGL